MARDCGYARAGPDGGGDLIDTFGPLASMHAALDAAGIGQPCALAAMFRGASVQAIEAAVAEAASGFPILNRRISYAFGRAALSTGPAAADEGARASLLEFSAAPQGQVWSWRVREGSEGACLEAAFAHAIADGMSMLRLVRAVTDRLGAPCQETPRLWQVRSAISEGSQRAWTARFLFDQMRILNSRPESAPRRANTGAWTHLDAAVTGRMLERAVSVGGVAGLLAAASLLALAETEGRDRLQSLEVPVVRRDMREWNGFGFGVGAVLLPTVVERRMAIDKLASGISGRVRRAVDSGWDRNLERFLGLDAQRHARFAGHHFRHPGEGPLTVSWKGARLWEADGVLGDVACFAASSNLHVSAHGDGRGLSISVAGPFGQERAQELLHSILDRLDAAPTRPTHILGN